MRELEKGILQGLIDYSDNLEVSSVFTLWTGISLIGAALGRDCYVDLGHFTVYPNMYILLSAPSAKCRKSTAIRIASKFARNAKPNIKLMPQKASPEALISNLAVSETDEEENKIIQNAEGYLIVDEAVTLIDGNAFQNGLIDVLTKLYDCDDFEYETKARGSETVKEPFLSLLGGVTLQGLKEKVPKAAIGGGFTSRIIFVYKNAPERLVPIPYISPKVRKLEPKIQHDVNQVRRLRGEFKMTDKALEIYSEEYKNFMTNSSLFGDPNLDGYAGRRHINLLKVAMIISASSRDDLKIDDVDMKIAINAMQLVETDMNEVLKPIRSEFVGDVSTEVLEIIKNSQRIARSSLVKKMSYKLSSQQLDVIIDTLLEYATGDGNKLIEQDVSDGRIFYVYKPKS